MRCSLESSEGIGNDCFAPMLQQNVRRETSTTSTVAPASAPLKNPLDCVSKRPAGGVKHRRTSRQPLLLTLPQLRSKGVEYLCVAAWAGLGGVGGRGEG